jgi:aspartyl-tRNA(Asn)/glutamyl-tRNA(Gln) amidotransferase subunit A
VPVGFTPAGLPVGLQIVGRRFADLTVLQASAAYEAARPWAGRRPPLDQPASFRRPPGATRPARLPELVDCPG